MLETCRRFRKAIADYCTNVHLQVQNCYETKIRRPEELIELRRDTIGVRPLFVFVEYAHELDLPDEVMDLPLVKEIETLGVDWGLIQNDLISYRQEEVMEASTKFLNPRQTKLITMVGRGCQSQPGISQQITRDGCTRSLRLPRLQARKNISSFRPGCR
jgi:hypothetical protein